MHDIPKFTRELRNRDVVVRQAAAGHLCTLAGAAIDIFTAVPVLLRALEDKDKVVRETSMRALRSYFEKQPPIPQSIRLFQAFVVQAMRWAASKAPYCELLRETIRGGGVRNYSPHKTTQAKLFRDMERSSAEDQILLIPILLWCYLADKNSVSIARMLQHPDPLIKQNAWVALEAALAKNGEIAPVLPALQYAIPHEHDPAIRIKAAALITSYCLPTLQVDQIQTAFRAGKREVQHSILQGLQMLPRLFYFFTIELNAAISSGDPLLRPLALKMGMDPDFHEMLVNSAQNFREMDIEQLHGLQMLLETALTEYWKGLPAARHAKELSERNKRRQIVCDLVHHMAELKARKAGQNDGMLLVGETIPRPPAKAGTGIYSLARRYSHG